VTEAPVTSPPGRPPRLRVGVLFGGRSSEHEVSLMSARSVLAALDPAKYDIVQIGITKEGTWRVSADAVDRLVERASAAGALEGEVEGTTPVALLADPSRCGQLVQETETSSAVPARAGIDRPIDVVFPLIHGATGEDGAIQGLLDLAGVAHVGAGILASAVAMDKIAAKAIWRAEGLPIAPYLALTVGEWRADRARWKGEVAARLGFPCFVKPANSGSSIGTTKVHDLDELEPAMEDAAQYDLRLLVEKGIDARELEVGVVGNERPEASVVGEVIPGREFYDYEDKYFDGKARLVIPAEIAEATAEEVREVATRAYRALDGSGMARVDFFLERPTGAVWLNEVNTIPGFTEASMFARLWEASGVPFPALCDRLIGLALERRAARAALRRTR
jgi:D-alanine-D-alanine ligase